MLLAVALFTAPALAQQREANRRRTPTVRVFEANRHAVVNVNSTHVIRKRFGLFGNDDFLQRFFGAPQMERNVERTSLGSGFIVHTDGYIVTNAHVVSGAEKIEVTLAGGARLPAEVLASDARQDLAVLKVDPPADAKMQAVELGASSDLLIGEPVVAIGNPLGYEHSVTEGIISATGRSLPVTKRWKLKGLIQTDASINPGNSGGPLLNAYGQVIGINTAIRGDAQNIGFAIPVNHLRSAAAELLSPRVINRVELGGRIIEQLQAQPPAEVEATLRWQPKGDEQPGPAITSINGQRVGNIVEAYVRLLGVEPGQTVTMTGPGEPVKVTARRAAPPDGQRLAAAMMGLRVKNLTPRMARRLGLRRADGLLVEGVDRDGPADQAGIRPGDVIVQVGSYRVRDLKSLAAVLHEAKPGMRADVYLMRQGRLGRAQLKLRSRQAGSL